jgi:hypothetical protein
MMSADSMILAMSADSMIPTMGVDSMDFPCLTWIQGIPAMGVDSGNSRDGRGFRGFPRWTLIQGIQGILAFGVDSGIPAFDVDSGHSHDVCGFDEFSRSGADSGDS